MKLLTIYIPIFNRSVYLERMLSVFSEDMELFKVKINLVISDNCSSENLKQICDRYLNCGLKLSYISNKTNIGADKNIIRGFDYRDTKYVWVLGSDDIPVSGFIRKLIPLIESNTFGLLHLVYGNDSRLKTYYDTSDFFEDIYIWTTFTSANIVSTKFIPNTDYKQYVNTCLAQIPVYMTAGAKIGRNACYYYPWKQDGDDNANNGGYNLFEVFVENFLMLVRLQVKNNLLSQKSYRKIKRKSCKSYIVGVIYKSLIYKKRQNHVYKNAWKYIFTNYGMKLYFYYYMIGYGLRELYRSFCKCI